MRKGHKRPKIGKGSVQFIRDLQKDLQDVSLAVAEAEEVLHLVVDFVKTGDRDNLEKARNKRNSASNRFRAVSQKLLSYNPMELM